MNIHRIILICLVLLSTGIFAQIDELEDVPTHMSERGFSFSLASNGLGLGGFYRFALPHYFTFGADLEFFALRDDKEFESYIYSPVVGQYVPYKLNNNNQLYLMPLNLSLKRRLFAETIEDNFRPHLMLQAGIIYGMNFPKDDVAGNVELFDANGDPLRVDNFQWSYDFVIGFGVDISTRKGVFATIRPQYRIVYFPDIIADKARYGHSAFEIKFELAGQF